MELENARHFVRGDADESWKLFNFNLWGPAIIINYALRICLVKRGKCLCVLYVCVLYVCVCVCVL